MNQKLKQILLLYKLGKITKEQLVEYIYIQKQKNTPPQILNNQKLISKPSNKQNAIVMHTPKLHPIVHQHKIYQYNISQINKQKKKLKKNIIQNLNTSIILVDNTQNDIESEERLKYCQSILHDDKAIRVEQVKYIKTLYGLSHTQKLIKLGRSKTIKEFKAEHNHSKKVVLLEGFIVRKIVDQTSFGNYMFWNEVRSLIKLIPYNHFPKLIAYDPNSLIIYMSYCGNIINHKNLPKNWRHQLTQIQENLTQADVNSNDMLVRNTCVLDNRINIIDFGLDTIFRKNIDVSMSQLFNQMLRLESKKK
jgi:hypothetical protein